MTTISTHDGMTIGLNESESGHIGVITIAFTSPYNIGPPADKL